MKRIFLRITRIWILIFLLVGCKSGIDSSSPETVLKSFPKFLYEAHRGASGAMPENTIPSMLRAIEAGSNVIELDVHISKDIQVVVTHDSRLNPSITLSPNGEEIPTTNDEKHLIYQMNYSDIRKYDVGTRLNRRFPEQEGKKAYIPLLGELIDSVEHFTTQNNYPDIIYNIEIKTTPGQDGLYQPSPPEYIDLVLGVVKGKNLNNTRYYLQSFDIKILQKINQKYPNVIIGFLTGNKENTLEENINELGFTPQIYSPNFSLVTVELIEKSHKAGMKLVPWTVNTREEMERLIEMGVDGIITDYPDRLREIKPNYINAPFLNF